MEDREAPDTTSGDPTASIETYLDALRVEEPFPEAALRTCVERIEDAAPALLAVLRKAADGEVLSPQEESLNFRGVHILGAARWQAAYEPLLRLLRRPRVELDKLLGDTIHEGVPKVIIGIFNGEPEALFAVIGEQTADEYVRASLLRAATILCWQGRIERDRMRRFIQRFHDEMLAEVEDYVWVSWVEAVGMLGFSDLKPIVEAAWDRLPGGVMEPRHFEEDLRNAESAPEDVSRFGHHRPDYIDDIVEELNWTRPREERTPPRTQAPVARPVYSTSSVVNLLRKVGRNDPCPCGSGKKYKKCCLATA